MYTIVSTYSSALNQWNQMIEAAKFCGVNLCQSNKTSKLIMTHGIHLSLFIYCFVNDVHIDKDEAVAPKENIPPPLVLKHLVIKLVNILKVITEFNWVHVMIVWIINIQTQKVSATYHLCFEVIHLQCFLNPFNDVATYLEKKNGLFFIIWQSNNTRKFGCTTNHRILHCYPTNTKWNRN